MASGKSVMVESVQRTSSRRMKFCVREGLRGYPGQAAPAAEWLSRGIACRYYTEFGISGYLDLCAFRYSFRYSVGSTCVTSLNALENFPCVSYPA